jgi:hypothetical protein
MRHVIAIAVGLALVGAMFASANAQTYRSHGGYKQKKKHYQHAEPRNHDPGDGYHEYLADKLPVGSAEWFQQMEREGRFGGGERR